MLGAGGRPSSPRAAAHVAKPALACTPVRWWKILSRYDGPPDEQVPTRQVPPLHTISRPYRPGDEVQINRLYLSLTGRDRSAADFAWEWLDTWAGQGSMNLVFDLDREEDDQLIAQYSLIPTPLSVWGRPMLAGKTENCMSHPDHRGTGVYFSHERECFEQEKKKYSFFFTTAGQVAGGSVGRIRTKLGYVAFDDWANYTLWLQKSALREDLDSILARGRSGKKLAPVASGLLATALQTYSRLRRPRPCRYRVAVHGADDAPLEEIAALWERNRRHYGVTVDRSASYLQWRVSDDPHVEHEYLTVHADGGLLGYAITFVQGDTLHVVDILADGAHSEAFRNVFAALIGRGRDLGLRRIKCLVLRRSVLLPHHLRSAGFVDTSASRLRASSSSMSRRSCGGIRRSPATPTGTSLHSSLKDFHDRHRRPETRKDAHRGCNRFPHTVPD
jgi:hypothetical protein